MTMPSICLQDFGADVATRTAVSVLSSSSSPGLPRGWNATQDAYALQYRAGTSCRYLVKVIPLGGTLIISALVRFAGFSWTRVRSVQPMGCMGGLLT